MPFVAGAAKSVQTYQASRNRCYLPCVEVQLKVFGLARPTETGVICPVLQVQLKVFGSYASHLGRAACVAILVLFGLYQVSSVYADVWLTHWTQDPTLLAANSSASAVVARNRYFLAYYGVLGAGQGRTCYFLDHGLL